MNCHDARELLSGLVDGELTPDEQSLVETHLAECADCRKEQERLGATVAVLRQMDRPRAPVGFVDRVLEVVRPTPWYRRWLGRLFLPLSVKLPAEAAALLLVGGLAVYVFQRTPELQEAARQQPAPPAARESELLRSDLPKTMASHPAETQPATETSPPPPSAPPSSSLPRDVMAPPASSGTPSPTLLSRSRDEAAREAARGKVSLDKKDVTPSEGDIAAARKAAPAPPAAPAPSSLPAQELAKREIGSAQESSGARQAPEPAPPASPAPALDQRIDAAKEKVMRLPSAAPPPSRSARRVLPSADVAGQLAVKDLDTAQRALADLLAQSGGVVISRREDAGTILVDVAVPKAAYGDFNAGLTRIGTWQSEGEPAQSATSVRVTLRLVQ